MEDKSRYQIVISGVGGQGVLFITRLLAEAAIEKGLPVFTSETHGMAQRGGTVISHLKIGEFASPLINPGRADGLIALKAESLIQHGGYLKPGGWAAVNSPERVKTDAPSTAFALDADRVARKMADPRSVNLIMLGFTLSGARRSGTGQGMLQVSLDDVQAVLNSRLKGKERRLQSSLRALAAGADSAEAP
ncbi:indolepyruvate oxidoreductase [Desulfosarcina alkanivorans]|uniref:Indolepyruvate oxidoreductase n=1 Tax=Desulfosarcina alkanivorans TaxID=571177 RepID=A0A5K7YIE0_9BACT|nr:2-oxoacid:acceptor oxidoreductase family protein [Desulfosarcina alkanivorans]BBO68916.1 indolepyruvate oxidoreductase [Desulfosarcina alkanivorans]